MKLIGYAAHNITLNTSASKTARLKNVTDKVLRKLITENLASLKKILEWNIKRNILYYRITSNLIPYASHPVNTINWEAEFKGTFTEIGKLIADNQIEVTMHPGQYTVLSSPNKPVVNRAIADIEYHNTVLDLLNTLTEAKICIHLGGGYGDKASAIKRFVKNYKSLSLQTRKRLVIENDDVTYNVNDCFEVHCYTGIPIVFDVLHYQINPNNKSLVASLQQCLSTWNNPAEVHYSEQAPNKPKGAHTMGVNLDNFLDFYNQTKDLNFRIMLETKDKEQSVLNIMNLFGNK